MKCPRCGAQVEEGKTVCFMCGSSLDGGGSSGFGGSDSDSFSTGFSSGETRMPGGGLDNYNPSLNEDYYRRKEEYNNRNSNYRERKEKITNTTYKKDMFDIISENKLLIRVVFILLLLALVGFLVVRWYKKKTAEPPKVPLINETLYYVIDDEAFKEIASGSSNSATRLYVLSGDKGNSCSINVSFGPSTSEDFISAYYKSIRAGSVQDLYDNDFVVKDFVKVPMFQEDQLGVNGTAWFYLYEYYRKQYPGEYTLLKNRYLNTVRDGYVYNVVLTNNNDDPKCNLYLDNFVRSLEFIKK